MPSAMGPAVRLQCRALVPFVPPELPHRLPRNLIQLRVEELGCRAHGLGLGLLMGQSNVVIIAGPITLLLVGMTYISPVPGIISRVTSFCTHGVISIWLFGVRSGPNSEE